MRPNPHPFLNPDPLQDAYNAAQRGADSGAMRLPRIASLLALMAAHCAACAVGANAEESLATKWRLYADRFITVEGRVVDNANGDVSHSEGQGYALLLAERLGDRDAFARIWGWTMRHLFVRDDALAAWRWDPKSTPNVTDHNNTTDGDLLIAWALSNAAARWNVSEYADTARHIADALATQLVVPSRFGWILLPAVKRFGAADQHDGPVVNLSYWVFPALEHLRGVSRKADWDAVATTGENLIRSARFGPRRIPTNWIGLADNEPAPAHAFAPVFGYDAIRIPLYLAWANSSRRKLLRSLPPLELAVIDVNTGQANEALNDPDYQAIAALVECAKSDAQPSLHTLNYNGQFYYPASLHLLSLVAARDLNLGCLE
jgi:endoglucanase